MSKTLNLVSEFDKLYKDSDLDKILSNKPLPIKYKINNVNCYFYNANLFGLFEWRIEKDDLTTNYFIDDYRKGFELGLSHLKTKEKIKLKDLKNVNLREHTISQIKTILFEREFKTGVKGLLDLVFNKVPLIFTEKAIFDYGYWNAIIFSLDDILDEKLFETPPIHPIGLNDYSDTNGKGKVIAFKELGILDFLQKKHPICQNSINQLAEVLSLLTGEKTSTLQSYLNPILSKQTSQKNNPYNNTKTVEKIKDKLINIGISSLK